MIYYCKECETKFENTSNSPEIPCPKCGRMVAVDKRGETVALEDGAGKGRGGRESDLKIVQEVLEEEKVWKVVDRLHDARALKRYKIIGEIGRGGIGAVVKAFDADLHRRIAMKILLSGRDATDTEVRRFLEEAQITAQLEHPNIVPIHNIAIDDEERIFFTMKFVEGLSLGRIIERLAADDSEMIDDWPLHGLLQMFLKICDGAAFAHSRGVIHRDLKPENIMIGAHGEVMIMDWGLAKILKSSEPEADAKFVSSIRQQLNVKQTVDGRFAGTPLYAAPEQVAGANSKIDERTDIYALGAMLFNIVALEPPIPGETVNEVIENVLHGRIKRMSKTAGGKRAPHQLEAICRKAMSFHRRDRYRSIRQLASDIQKYLRDVPVKAAKHPVWEIAWLWMKRHRNVTALGILILTFLALVIFQGRESRKKIADKEKQVKQAKVRIESMEGDIKREWVLRHFDTFQAARLSTRWIPVSGNWSIEDGELVGRQQTPGQAKPLAIGMVGEPLNDIRIEFDVWTDSETVREISCFVNMDFNRRRFDPTSGVFFRFGGSGTYSSIRVNGETVREGVTAAIERGKKYRVFVERFGRQLTFTIDDQKILSTELTRPITFAKRTLFGVHTQCEHTHFDNFKVYRYGFAKLIDPIELADNFMEMKELPAARYLYQTAYESAKTIRERQELMYKVAQTQLAENRNLKTALESFVKAYRIDRRSEAALAYMPILAELQLKVTAGTGRFRSFHLRKHRRSWAGGHEFVSSLGIGDPEDHLKPNFINLIGLEREIAGLDATPQTFQPATVNFDQTPDKWEKYILVVPEAWFAIELRDRIYGVANMWKILSSDKNPDRHPNLAPLLEGGRYNGVPYWAYESQPNTVTLAHYAFYRRATALVSRNALDPNQIETAMQTVDKNPETPWHQALAIDRARFEKDFADYKRIPPQEAAPIIRQLANGLKALHEKGILMHSVDPHNILIARDGNTAMYLPHLHAELLENAPADRDTAIGFPDYLSPQAWQRENDFRNDIYSLGVVAYQLLTGMLPVNFDNNYQAAHERMLEYRIVPPAELFPNEISTGLSNAVMKMLAYNIQQRYQNADEALRDLDAALARPAAETVEGR